MGLYDSLSDILKVDRYSTSYLSACTHKKIFASFYNHVLSSAVKQLIMINHIQNQVLIYIIIVCVLCIFIMYINAHTYSIYFENIYMSLHAYIYICIIYIMYIYIYMYVCVCVFIHA